MVLGYLISVQIGFDVDQPRPNRTGFYCIDRFAGGCGYYQPLGEVIGMGRGSSGNRSRSNDRGEEIERIIERWKEEGKVISKRKGKKEDITYEDIALEFGIGIAEYY